MKRFRQLDGIRGVAIILVLLHHYLFYQLFPEPHTILSYLRASLALTWSGVDLFFVLSGFLITGILIDNRNTPNYYRVFYLRRICRIFPLYFVVILLYTCFAHSPLFHNSCFSWLFDNPLPIWSYSTFTQNILMGLRGDFGANWLAVTWSLAVEEQFYLLMPLLIRALPRVTAFYVFAIAIAAAPLLRCFLSPMQAYTFAPCRADSLLSGACLAAIVRWPTFILFAKGHARLLLALFVTFLGGAAIITFRPVPFGVFASVWLAALYVVFIVLALVSESGIIGRSLSHSVLVWFGTRSYGIYLFHQPISGLLHALLNRGPPAIRTFPDLAVTGMALLLTLLICETSWRFIEQPLLTLGHRFGYATSRTSPSRPAVESTLVTPN